MSDEKYIIAILKIPIRIAISQSTFLIENSSIDFEPINELPTISNEIDPQTIKNLCENIKIPEHFFTGSPKENKKLFISKQEIKQTSSHKKNMSFKNKSTYTSKYTVKNYSKIKYSDAVPPQPPMALE
jgi:hypothetical protein